MYISPIQITDNRRKDHLVIESLSLDPLNENSSTEESIDVLYTEAVFADGKSQLANVVKKVEEVKKLLEAKIKEQDDIYEKIKEWNKTPKGEPKGKKPEVVKFDPKAFWKDKVFKDLEDEISKVFGFRSVQIMPYIEKYNSSEKIFESKELNAFVYHMDRYPVEALISDKGLYDKSKSIMLDMRMSLGLIKALTAEEIVAVMLHEIGHNIDPANVDIKFMETNILSKYITDRKNAINKQEEKFIKKHKLSELACGMLILLLYYLIMMIPLFWNKIKELIIGKEKMEQKRLEKIRKVLQQEKNQFNRQTYTEAFADNFARMYGFGPQLMSALKKMAKDLSKRLNSRIKKETARQEAIVSITLDMIKDVHKTDIHRIRNLIREYEADIKDPNIPEPVKKQLRDDLSELEKVLDEYTNNFSNFQNRVNELIYEELRKMDEKEERKKLSEKDKAEKEKAIKEGVIFFDDEEFSESKAAYEKLMKAKKSLNSTEYAEVHKKFGYSKECSFGKDKDGYYCFTHRARSKSYPTIDDIPQKDVDFVRSTS